MKNDTLNPTEAHPAAHRALAYITSLGPTRLLLYQESFSSLAIDGNRLAEVCSGTLSRILNGENVSDRYVLGLAWTIKHSEELNDE